MIYLDTSAIVTLMTGRAYAPELRAFLAEQPRTLLGTSTIGFVEAVRTLDQFGDYPSAMDDLARNFTEILVKDEVRDAAARLPRGIRTLDAVHVASAQILEDALDVLISYDKRMLEVATSVGLPTAAPGMP